MTAAAAPAFDPSTPCRMCGLPVVELSFGGPEICPWCDCGIYRDGQRFTFREVMNTELIKRRVRENFGMEDLTRLEPKKLGVYVKLMTPESSHDGFIPFAPDIIDLEEDE